MEEKNELNDIILNKGGGASANKKIILAVATLGVILIIVVMLMNTLTSNGTNNLPQAVLPPEPKVNVETQVKEEPLFEDIDVLDEESQNNDNLDKIAQRLKQESIIQKEAPEEIKVVAPVKSTPIPKAPAPVKKVEKVKPVVAKPAVVTSPIYYIQVGSFSRFEPNKKFLKSITNNGYSYKYHKVKEGSKTINKVLIGPFDNEKDARKALRAIRTGIEAGAFVVKI